MAKEHGEYMVSLMDSLPKGDPYRKFLRGVIKANKAEQRRLEKETQPKATTTPLIPVPEITSEMTKEEALAAKLERARRIGILIRDSFLGEVPDSSPIGEIFPPDRFYEFHLNAARDERWAPVFSQLDRRSKQAVSRAFKLLSGHVGANYLYRFYNKEVREGSRAQIVGDLRGIGENQVLQLETGYNPGFGLQTALIISNAFSRPPETGKEHLE